MLAAGCTMRVADIRERLFDILSKGWRSGPFAPLRGVGGDRTQKRAAPRRRHQPRRAAAPNTQAPEAKIEQQKQFCSPALCPNRRAGARRERAQKPGYFRAGGAELNKTPFLLSFGRRDLRRGRRVRRGGSPAASFCPTPPKQPPGRTYSVRRGFGRGRGPGAAPLT